MKETEGSGRSPDLKRRVLYSPSTCRVITRLNSDLMGTIQLNADFQTERVIYAAPIGISEMSASWSNEDVDDWEEREVIRLKDLADPGPD